MTEIEQLKIELERTHKQVAEMTTVLKSLVGNAVCLDGQPTTHAWLPKETRQLILQALSHAAGSVELSHGYRSSIEVQVDAVPPICLEDILDMVPKPSLTVPIHVQTVGGHELPFVGVSTQISPEGEQVGIVFRVDAKEEKKP